MSNLTHFDSKGAAHMVDISDKRETTRTAVAIGEVLMNEAAFAALDAGTVNKGDVLGVARLAGIMGAKKTADLIPLCHPLAIAKIALDFELVPEKRMVIIRATVRTNGKTGVEMEALTAVSVCALTIYDMLKAVDKGMTIRDIHLLEKTGGKSGDFHGAY